MDHEVGKSTSPPKLLKMADYPSWKERFENFARFSDIRMWICIKDGYIAPSVEFEGSIKVTSYSAMKDEDKRMYEAENKGLAAITMCLPQEILHTFRTYRTAKELWEGLEKRYEWNTQMKRGRTELIKATSNTGTQSAGSNSTSRAFVVQHQDGSYDWRVHTEEHGKDETQAFMAEIDDTEIAVTRLETEAVESEADVPAQAYKETEVCITCTDLAGRIESLVESNRTMSAQLTTLKEENALLKQRGSALKTTLKDNVKDLKVFQIKVNEQQLIIDLAYEKLEERTRLIADKQKELSDAQVKLVELNRKLEQFRNSSVTLNHLIHSQRQSHDGSGLGYNEVPPPFNGNYSSLLKEEDLTCFDYSTTTDVTPTTVKIPAPVTFVKEEDLTNDTPILDSESTERVRENHSEESSSPSTPETGESSDTTAPLQTAFKKRTCFICHEMGHVASCCPTRKGRAPFVKVRKAKSPVQPGNNQGSSAGNGNKSGLGNQERPQLQRSQSRFFPPRNDRPRSNSPRTPNSSGQSSHSHNSQEPHASQRYQPSHRSSNNRCCHDIRFQRPCSTFRNFNTSNTNYRSAFQQRRHGYSQFPRVSKSPDRCNGYLKAFTFVDENGRSKTVMAWIPRDN